MQKDHESWIIVGLLIGLLLLVDFFVIVESYSFRIGKLVVIALLSMFVIMKSSHYALIALSKYGLRTGISEFTIGFVIITIGTALPDLSNAIFASLYGKSDLVLGNALGANVLLVTLVLGVTLLFAHKMQIVHRHLNETFYTAIGSILLTLLLGLDGAYSRIDGGILVGCFVLYLLRHLHHEQQHGHVKHDVPWKILWKPMVVFVGTLFALLLAARWFVFSTITLSEELAISPLFMGIIFVALGTTIPELTVGIHAARRGLHHLGLGNSVGGIVVNFGLVLGIGALIHPIHVEFSTLIVSVGFMLLSLLLIGYFLQQKAMTSKHGIVLCVLYLLFVVIEAMVV